MISIFFLFIGLVIGAMAGRKLLLKQNMGEALVANTLEKLHCLHVLINNVTLPTESGTTQIDHVLITEAGVFIIETKHYTGWILGNPRDEKWTQVIYRTKNQFQNPLRQNYCHVKTVQALFKLPESAFIGVVVFTWNAEFRTDLGPNTILLDQLLGFIEQRREKILDERQMAYVVGRIEMKRLGRSTETDEYHVNYVRNKISQRG
jgi:restriction system protein